MQHKFIADVHCDRLVYFTDNINEELATDDNLYIAYTEKELPEGMTLKNCWNWKWNSITEELVYSVKKKDVEPLFEQNKSAVRTTLKNVIDTARNSLYSSYAFDDVVNNFIFRELFLEKENQLYLHAIAEVEQKDVEVVKAEFQAKRKKMEDVLFLTEITKRHFEKLIEDCDNQRDLYKIRNDIVATNLLKQYDDMVKDNLTLIQ
jgi:hypothetical protein